MTDPLAETDVPRDAGSERFGVIDIGSNSVRLVVFDGASRSPAYFFNEKVYCGLGAGMDADGNLSAEAREQTRRTLHRFALLLRTLDVDGAEAVATAALREARDGPAFVEQLNAETGLGIRVIDGTEEARYAALGVLLGEQRAEGLVVDIGGASLEMARIGEGEVWAGMTLPLGPLRLRAGGHEGEALTSHVADVVANAAPPPFKAGETLYLVGGGWRAFATLDIHRRSYPLRVLHGYELTPEAALETAEWSIEADATAHQAHGVSRARAENASLTSLVLSALVRRLSPGRIVVSACGLREGVLYDHLAPEMQRADPLIQSALFMERRFGRAAGFGAELSAWMSAALPEMPSRLRLAACSLADVNWRVHPDYRATACITTATQPSLLGLTHRERMILAVALAHRYKGGRRALSDEGARDLLDAEEMRIATAAGRLIRLGAMLCGASQGVLPDTTLHRFDTELHLDIPEAFVPLLSATVMRRLRSAAEALDLTPVLSGGGIERDGSSV